MEIDPSDLSPSRSPTPARELSADLHPRRNELGGAENAEVPFENDRGFGADVLRRRADQDAERAGFDDEAHGRVEVGELTGIEREADPRRRPRPEVQARKPD